MTNLVAIFVSTIALTGTCTLIGAIIGGLIGFFGGPVGAAAGATVGLQLGIATSIDLVIDRQLHKISDDLNKLDIEKMEFNLKNVGNILSETQFEDSDDFLLSSDQEKEKTIEKK
ncbi:hypothetical protein M0813_01186 [Anaeramoeba flamelloides]|uniref:NAD(+)--protein-arginine ADP-ribosyltransferase Tre1-like N-terminal domain-containing protein n=1 Tax=Anaeramoeba flamelloides TaxID=1746091 RepID=A0ABQ8X2J4_9EUKA|nr:hypothetical protein M0813_01186 [Anaeramoeba flamelloides]